MSLPLTVLLCETSHRAAARNGLFKCLPSYRTLLWHISIICLYELHYITKALCTCRMYNFFHNILISRFILLSFYVDYISSFLQLQPHWSIVHSFIFTADICIYRFMIGSLQSQCSLFLYCDSNAIGHKRVQDYKYALLQKKEWKLTRPQNIYSV